ncbi:hypothetical protein [uncultured Microbacterium sp.]|uniref:hypothetical protein n=1 Tax=uncultured Microbacterium sp. TaxID=191216 RepID=UPI0025E37191|nr:hypothetical protein [uncultured Microbacterium sp.]
MTGRYEQALMNLAEGGAPFDVPVARDLVEKLSSLKNVVSGAAQLPGIEGEAAEAAKAKFAAAAETIGQQITYLEGSLDEALRLANGQRDAAREKLSALPAGSLSGGQETVVRSAAVGTTLFLGPISLLAGEGAVQAFNAYLAQQREQQAEGDFTTISQTLNGMSPPTPPPAALSSDGGRAVELEEDAADPSTDNPGERPFGGGGRDGYASFPVPRGPAPSGGVEVPTSPPAHLLPAPDTPRGPGIDLGQVPPHYTPPTPDGSISGIGTLPGHVSGPGSIGGFFPGGISGGGAGLGSGLSAGLIAGGGGAAALSRLSSGTGLNTTAAGRPVSGSGGLLGKSGTTATGAGLGGRSGTGSLGGGAGGTGTSGTGANAAAAGSRGIGTTATTGGAGGGTAGGGTAGGGTAGAAGSRGAGGMGSGPGSRSDRRDERRGLGGPIAPRLEDDEETGPRSENAAAGSRDD